MGVAKAIRCVCLQMENLIQMGQPTTIKGNKKSTNSQGGRSDSMVRTTIVIPLTLDQNLEAIRLKKGGISKNDLIKTALATLVESEGLKPDRHPVVQISY